MRLDIKQTGEHAYAVRTDAGRELGIVRLVDVVRRKPTWDGCQFRFPTTTRVWMIDGYPTREFGNRDAAIEGLKWMAGRSGRI
ncbi:MAG: hypothetical protein DHS20C21_09200 [Gemmatimonadota bacterium]|nr:MAG: hypothetical protein DHS20C21_09200 [Gemmatimonadota bacterium]